MIKLISKNKLQIYFILAILATLIIGSIVLLLFFPGWRVHLFGLLLYLLILGYLFSSYKRANEEAIKSREELNFTNQLLYAELTERKSIEKKCACIAKL